MTNPEISVLVVTYNSADDIADCIASLSIQSDMEVLVWDNASTDHTLEVLNGIDGSAHIECSTENVGFSRAVNGLACHASGRYVMLLNPDCRITPEAVREMVRMLASQPSTTIMAPAIEHPNGRLETRSAGYEPTIRHLFNQAVGLSRSPVARRFPGFNLYPAGESSDGLTAVDWVSGACLLVRRALWLEVGGLNERWFMYAEDLDFCRKVRSVSGNVYHYSGITATHEVGASSADSSTPWTLWLENLADYYVVNFRPSKPTFGAWKLVYTGSHLLRAAVYQWRSKIRPSPSISWNAESHRFLHFAQTTLKLTMDKPHQGPPDRSPVLKQTRP